MGKPCFFETQAEEKNELFALMIIRTGFHKEASEHLDLPFDP
jgi:hypothetical protein